MQIKSFLSAVIVACCSMLMSNSESNEVSSNKIIIEFRDDGKCFIECDGNQHLFKNLDSLSKNINFITNQYFTTSLIATTSSNSIVFNNFKSSALYYELYLIANSNVIIDYCYNNLNIPEIKISRNINCLNIYTGLIHTKNFAGTYNDLMNRGYINENPIEDAFNYK